MGNHQRRSDRARARVGAARQPITRDITGEEVYSSIYAMVESRLERGVIWVGANDGPVHVSRDNGKTWKNVTPKGLAPGGRVQNIEDSPHRKGSAYIAVYRFLREHDLKPYIYRTDDYGANWTLLTDGKNGIPSDFPTRVVREDPAREDCCTPEPNSRRSYRSTTGATGSRFSRTCRPRSPTSRPPQRLVIPPWGARCGSWTTSRRCSSSPR